VPWIDLEKYFTINDDYKLIKDIVLALFDKRNINNKIIAESQFDNIPL